MTTQEVLEGLTNDLVLQRLKKFLIQKGLPEGKYLLVCSEMTTADEGYKGKIELALYNSNVKALVVFKCGKALSSDLSLEIDQLNQVEKKNGKLIYRFSGVLRPNRDLNEVSVEP